MNSLLLGMKKIYAVLNVLAIVIVVAWNYVAGAQGIDGNTMRSLSEKYNTLFTPDGYAFAIWGWIFLLLLVHAWYQISRVFIKKKHDEFVLQMGPWFIIANLANAAWLYFWLTEQIGISVVLMLIILGSLLKIVFNLNMQRWDAPFKMIRTVWWPVTFYLGWICVATIANVAAFYVQLGWHQSSDQEFWTVVMIGAAVVLNLFMLFNRSMREFASVGVWALLAISIRHWGEIPILQWSALIGVVILSIGIGIHAKIHWQTNPLYKWMKG